jgi:hypothetical protein
MPMQIWYSKRRPEPMSRKIHLVERNKGKADAVVLRSALKQLRSAVAGMAVSIEKLGKPSVAIVTNRFVETARTRAKKSGMPNARLVFVPHPVSGKTPAQHEAMVAGKDPATGKLVMQEIVDALSKPLTEEDQKGCCLE